MKDKKGITVVIATLLLLILASIIGVIMYTWGINMTSEWNAKNELSGNVGELEIISLKIFEENETSVLLVKNRGTSYHIINQIKLEGGIYDKTSCLILSTDVVDNFDNIYLNCSVINDTNYVVRITSDKGFFTNTVTVLETFE